MASEQDLIFHSRVVGGPGGQSFYLKHYLGSPVVKVGAWGTGETVRGIAVWFEGDGREYLYGTKDGEYQELTLDPARKEYITEWQLGYSTYRTGRCGWLRLVGSNGRRVDAGDWRTPNEATGQVAKQNGVLLGIQGRAGADIDALGFIFQQAVDHVELSNLRFDTTQRRMTSVDGALTLELRNRSSTKQKVTGTLAHQWSESTNFSHTAGLKVGVKFGIKAGDAKIGIEKSLEFSVEGNWSWTWGHAETKTVSRQLALEANVEPHTSVWATAMIMTGEVTVPYTADATFYPLDQRTPPFVMKDFRGVLQATRGLMGEVEYGDHPPLKAMVAGPPQEPALVSA